MSGPQVLAHTRMRRAVIRTVTASNEVPQYTVEMAVDALALLDLRHQMRSEASVTDLLHAAVARALTSHPLLNASWTEAGTVVHDRVDLAFIVEVGDGMMTPVVRDADTLTPARLADARRDLTGRAREGRLGPEELADATFTVSNLGTFGVRRFSAMVLPPQSAVLAVGAIDRDGQWCLTLTLDHRVVDGATAARFLVDLRRALEAPQDLATPIRNLEGSA